MKESLKTCVSLLALNGVCGLFRPRALMHSCRTQTQMDRDTNMTQTNFFLLKIILTKTNGLLFTNKSNTDAFHYFLLASSYIFIFATLYSVRLNNICFNIYFYKNIFLYLLLYTVRLNKLYF